MKNYDALSNHWTDDQLIAHLYGLSDAEQNEQEHSHIGECGVCRSRLQTMRTNRMVLEREHSVEAELHPDELARQRRSIYAKIDGDGGHAWKFHLRRWAVAACGVVVVSTAGWMWEHSAELKQQGLITVQRAKVSDDQLVDDASEVADRAEPKAAAPLQALFEN